MIKTLLKSMRQYKKVSWATIFFSTFEVVFEIVIPLCMSGLIDNGIEGGVMSMVWKYGLALLFLAVFQMVTGMLAAFLGSRASAGSARICAAICMIMFRPSHSRTSTNSRPRR